MKPFLAKLAFIYFGSKRQDGFINVISLISIVGILLGTAVLITVLSIMNGFQTELRDRILGMTAHLSIFEQGNEIANWQQLRQLVLQNERIIGAAPNISKQALVSHQQQVKGVMVRGILPDLEPTVGRLSDYLDQQTLKALQAGRYKVILGAQLASDLAVTVGDKVTLMVPQVASSILGQLPRMRRFEVVGLMDVGMFEYDSSLLIVHMHDAAKLYRMADKVSNLQLQTSDLFAVEKVIFDLSQVLSAGDYYALTWRQQHANFFEALVLEKRIMFIIIFLIVAVAAFNIVSTMVMVINEKHATIAIMRTQGARRGDIVKLFFTQGLLIGLCGTLLGCLLGVLIAWNIETIVPFIEDLFNIHFFPPEVYYITQVPAEIQSQDVIMVAGFALLSSLLATIYPAWKASKIEPAEVLRHE